MSALSCQHCDDGEVITADGTTHFTCPTCHGSNKARCTVCSKGAAVVDDGHELLCAACVAEVLADEARDLVAREAAAILLPILTYAAMRVALAVSLERMRRDAGLRPWAPTPRSPRVIVCNYDGERACDADEGQPCPACTASTPRHDTMIPGAHDYLAALPALARVDPDSSTWRAMRATSIETVRPAVSQ